MTTTAKPKRARILRPIRFSKKTVIFFFSYSIVFVFLPSSCHFLPKCRWWVESAVRSWETATGEGYFEWEKGKRGTRRKGGEKREKERGERSSGIFFVCAFLFFVFLARRLRPSLPHCLIFHSSSLRLWQPFPCTGGIWVLPSFCFPNCCVNAPKILAFLPLSPWAPQSVNILSLWLPRLSIPPDFE